MSIIFLHQGNLINLVRPAEIKKKGVTEAEAVSRMVEYTDRKDAAAQHT